jgi:hypothetical protein
MVIIIGQPGSAEIGRTTAPHKSLAFPGPLADIPSVFP